LPNCDARRSADSSPVAYDSQAIQTIYKGITNIFSSGQTLIECLW
jgi:hypothetical protein